MGETARGADHGRAVTRAQVDRQATVTQPVVDLADVHLEEATSDDTLHRTMILPRHCTPPPMTGASSTTSVLYIWAIATHTSTPGRVPVWTVIVGTASEASTVTPASP